MLMMNSIGNTRTCYIDQINGNDSNSGFKPEDSWATISKINNSEFLAGDTILFCGGQTFDGTFHLEKLHGTAESKITISSYGAGRATISAGNSAALIADSCGLQIWNGQSSGPEMKNAMIYNNVFYNDFGKAVNYKSGDVPGIIYWNNVFVSRM